MGQVDHDDNLRCFDSECVSCKLINRVKHEESHLWAAMAEIWSQSYRSALSAPNSDRIDVLIQQHRDALRIQLSDDDNVLDIWREVITEAAVEAADDSVEQIIVAIRAPMPAGLSILASDSEISVAAKMISELLLLQAINKWAQCSPSNSDMNDAFEALVAMVWTEMLRTLGMDERYPYPGCVRATNEAWWRRHLYKIIRRQREVVEILIKRETNQEPQYASACAIESRKDNVNRRRRLLDRMFHDDDATSRIDTILIEKRRKRAELTSRLWGMAARAAEDGLTPYMVTITVPAEWHIGSPNWNSSTPDQIYKMLLKQWERWRSHASRATLSRTPLASYGIRVVEPHRDGTPHFHLLIWTDDIQRMESSLRQYFLDEIRSMHGGDNHRIVIAEVQNDIGSVIYYLMKHLPSINEHGDTGAANDQIDAWRATWGIRSYGCFRTDGRLPPITQWRALRRLDQVPTHSPSAGLHAAARRGDYAAYWREWDAVSGIAIRRERDTNKGVVASKLSAPPSPIPTYMHVVIDNVIIPRIVGRLDASEGLPVLLPIGPADPGDERRTRSQ